MPKIKTRIVFFLMLVTLFNCKADPKQQLMNWDLKKMVIYLRENGLKITSVKEYNQFGESGTTIYLNEKEVDVSIVDPELQFESKLSLNEFSAGKFLFSSKERELIYHIQTILNYRETPESKRVKKLNENINMERMLWKGHIEGGWFMKTYVGSPQKVFFTIKNNSGKKIKAIYGLLIFKDEQNNYKEVIEVTNLSDLKIFEVKNDQVTQEINFMLNTDQIVVIETTDSKSTGVYTDTSEEFINSILSKVNYSQSAGYTEAYSYIKSDEKLNAFWITEKIVFEDNTELSL